MFVCVFSGVPVYPCTWTTLVCVCVCVFSGVPVYLNNPRMCVCVFSGVPVYPCTWTTIIVCLLCVFSGVPVYLNNPRMCVCVVSGVPVQAYDAEQAATWAGWLRGREPGATAEDVLTQVGVYLHAGRGTGQVRTQRQLSHWSCVSVTNNNNNKGKGTYTWYSASSWIITSEVFRYGTCSQGISQFYLHIHMFICNRNEPYLPLPSQL